MTSDNHTISVVIPTGPILFGGDFAYVTESPFAMLVVGTAIEYFKVSYGETQFHLVATGLLLAVVVLFMPDGVIPAVHRLLARFRPEQSSIREVTAAELRERERAEVTR
jgi:hypothetical protein